MEAVKMKRLKREYIYRFLIVFITASLCLGFHPDTSSIKIITKGNQKYLANTIIIKFKNYHMGDRNDSLYLS